ncbi:hypothetical protein L1887_15007 [Cichorium endivia]|nr:hypothetical protein L1887_15007 [Cichorium endivia]
MPKTHVEKTKTQTLVDVDFVSIAPLVASVNSTTRRLRHQHHSSPLTLVFLPINWPPSLGKIMVVATYRGFKECEKQLGDSKGFDYSEMSMAYRPSHADATYDFKYGVRSVEGGGRSSARETIGRVAPGAVAKKILKAYAGIEILAYVSQAHKVVLPEDLVDHSTLTFDQVNYENIIFE